MSERAPAGASAAAGPYPLFMLVLCVYVLAALAAQTFFSLRPETQRILDLADFAISFVFLYDFVRSLKLADDRLRYLVTWGWIDLLSSIPTIGVMRWGRAARIFRILRVLRGFRATRILTTAVLERRAECAALSVGLVAMLAIVFGSIAILHLEGEPASNIASAEEALWWAFVTVTTVGYGDFYPVTAAGRLLAAFLMIVGIALFGTLTAFVASAFMAPGDAQREREIARLAAEVAKLRATIEARKPEAPSP